MVFFGTLVCDHVVLCFEHFEQHASMAGIAVGSGKLFI